MSTAPTINAIRVRYDGHLFRSKLEARWAVFFNHAGIEYDYEPNTYQLPNGDWYRPDFWLPNINGGIWFEVKGPKPTREERVKAAELVNLTSRPAFIAYGNLPKLHDSQDPANWAHKDLETGEPPHEKYINWELFGKGRGVIRTPDLYPGRNLPGHEGYAAKSGWTTVPRVLEQDGNSRQAHGFTACPLCGTISIQPWGQEMARMSPRYCGCAWEFFTSRILESHHPVYNPAAEEALGEAMTLARKWQDWEPGKEAGAAA